MVPVITEIDKNLMEFVQVRSNCSTSKYIVRPIILFTKSPITPQICKYSNTFRINNQSIFEDNKCAFENKQGLKSKKYNTKC